MARQIVDFSVRQDYSLRQNMRRADRRNALRHIRPILPGNVIADLIVLDQVEHERKSSTTKSCTTKLHETKALNDDYKW